MKISNVLIGLALGLIVASPMIEGLALKPLFAEKYKELAGKGGINASIGKRNESSQILTTAAKLKNINVVVLSDASLGIKSSENFYVNYRESSNHSLFYEVRKDTLYVWNDRVGGDATRIFSSSGVTIGMPRFKKIIVTNKSYLTFDNFEADSLDMKVFNGENSGVVSFLNCKFENLKCDIGNNSSAFFDSDTRIKNLDLTLENARLVIGNTKIENIKSSISATPNTSLEVKGEALKHFLK